MNMNNRETIKVALLGFIERKRIRNFPSISLQFKIDFTKEEFDIPDNINLYVKKLEEFPHFCRSEHERIFKSETFQATPSWFYKIQVVYLAQIYYRLSKGMAITSVLKNRTDSVLKATCPDDLPKDISQYFLYNTTTEHQEPVQKRTSENILKGASKEQILEMYQKCKDPIEKKKLRRMARQLNLSIRKISHVQAISKFEGNPEKKIPRSRKPKKPHKKSRARIKR